MLGRVRQAAIDWRMREPLPAGGNYLNASGLGLALLAAIVLCWPMLLVDGPLYYADTLAYLHHGEKIVGAAMERLSPVPSLDPTAGAMAAQAGDSGAADGAKLRSIPYSLYAYLTAMTPAGLWITCVLQAAAVLWTFLVLVPRLEGRMIRRAAIGFAGVAGFTSLPWFVSYAMPDILGAILPVFYIAVLGRTDKLAWWQTTALVILATGAVLSHYGHLPLAGALALLVIGWRWFERSLKPMTIVLCLLPVLLAALANYGAGRISTGEDSIAPKRLPILLARSLEDGPARWYLEDACPTATYAICDLFETMPNNIGSFLWAEDGYGKATDAQVEAIRREENTILLEAFRRYPVTQARALLGNAALQTVAVGTGEMWTLPPGAPPFDISEVALGEEVIDRPALRIFDIVIPLATGLAFLALILAWWRGLLGRDQFLALAVTFAALAINAAIFGGLSAPVDRYQSRLVWLLPALLTVYATRWPNPTPVHTRTAPARSQS